MRDHCVLQGKFQEMLWDTSLDLIHVQTNQAKRIGGFKHNLYHSSFKLFQWRLAPTAHGRWLPAPLGKALGTVLQCKPWGMREKGTDGAQTLSQMPIIMPSPVQPRYHFLSSSTSPKQPGGWPWKGESISRRHAIFWLRRREFVKEKLVSSNQILINLQQDSQIYKFPQRDIKLYLQREQGGIST